MATKFLTALTVVMLAGAAPASAQAETRARAEALPHASLEAVAWRPTLGQPAWVLPKLSNENLRAAINAYFTSVQNDPELKLVSVGRDEIPFASELRRAPQARYEALVVANQKTDHLLDNHRMREVLRPLRTRGLTPMLLPVGATARLSASERREFHLQLAQRFAGVVFIGGDDLEPDLYGQTQTFSRNLNRTRDELEIALVKDVLEMGDAFILGICRGAQLINVAMKGQLYQEVSIEFKPTGERVNHGTGERDVRPLHEIHLLPTSTSMLKNALGEQPTVAAGNWIVNSSHHQGIVLNPDGPLEVAAVSTDGLTEAFELPGRALGIQSHPERSDPTGFGERVMNDFSQRVREISRQREMIAGNCVSALTAAAN